MDFDTWSIIQDIVGLIIIIILLSGIRILKEYERGVVYQLGRVLAQPRGPGITYIIPLFQRMARVNLQIDTIELKKQDVITKDSVTLTISAVLYYHIVDPIKSEIAISSWLDAVEQLGYASLRVTGGKFSLDGILLGGSEFAQSIKSVVDEQTEQWGIQVGLVEIRTIDLPESMQRSIAAEAEAERQRRAKIINADGELQASEKLRQAAETLEKSPISVQLRYMQTLAEIGADNNTIVVFPLPMDILTLLKKDVQSPV